MITISYINIWIQPYKEYYLTKFIEHNIGSVIWVEPNMNPDILIVSCFGDINNIINLKAKCKIFYYGENLNRYQQYNDEQLLMNTFDLIVGFKYTNLEKKLIRFPLWLIYYNYYDYKSNSGDNLLTYIENKYQENKYKKNKNKENNIFASLIANHDRDGQRIKICNELSKYGKIMFAGNFNNNTSKIGPTTEHKINYISNSIYNICPENSMFEGYFTEKIFQAFEGGTIPLYWAIDYPEKDMINKNKYCFCNINNVKELQKSIYNVVTYPELYFEGNIFTENAGNIIKEYYETLSYNIKIKLGL